MSSRRVSSGDEGLDADLGGGLTEGSVILVAGGSGTGKTILGNQFIAKGKELGETSMIIVTAEGKEAYISHLNQDCKEFLRGGGCEVIELHSVSGEDVPVHLMHILARGRELKIRRLLIDSFTPLAQALKDPVEIRSIIQRIRLQLGGPFGCTTFLIVDVPKGEEHIGTGVEEFIADGIIELGLLELDGHGIKQLTLRKLRGAFVPHHILPYSLEGGRFRVIVPFTLKPRVDVGRFQPVQDTADRFSTGIPEFDLLLGGGYPRGSVVLVDLGEQVSFPQYRLVVDPVVWNFLAQKRGRTTIGGTGRISGTFRASSRRAGLSDDEVSSLTTYFRYVEEGSEPQRVKLEGDFHNDVRAYGASVEKLAQATGQPIIETISVDTLSSVYEVGEVMRFLDLCVRTVRERGYLLLLMLRSDGVEVRRKVKSVADMHLRMDVVQGALVLMSLKPESWLRFVQEDASMGYALPRFVSH